MCESIMVNNPEDWHNQVQPQFFAVLPMVLSFSWRAWMILEFCRCLLFKQLMLSSPDWLMVRKESGLRNGKFTENKCFPGWMGWSYNVYLAFPWGWANFWS